MQGNSRRLLELTRHLPGSTEENHIKITNTCNASAEIQTRNLPHSRDSVVKHSDPAEGKQKENWKKRLHKNEVHSVAVAPRIVR